MHIEPDLMTKTVFLAGTTFVLFLLAACSRSPDGASPGDLPGEAQIKALESVSHYVSDRAPASVVVESQTKLEFEGHPIEVLRDSYGVPHVFADDETALFFAQGYLMAEDRLWQMELYRRFAEGRLAEIEGEPALEVDRIMRRVGLNPADLQSNFEQLSPRSQSIYQAFSQGVNAFVQAAQKEKRLPEEFTSRGIKVSPWTPSDSIAVGAMLWRRVMWPPGASLQLENLDFYRLLRKKAENDEQAMRTFNDLVWYNDPASPTTMTGPAPKAVRLPDSVPPNLKAVLNMAPGLDTSRFPMAKQQEFIEGLAPQYTLPYEWASYAWVVGPKHSVGGTAMLIGGPEFGFSSPQVFHEIHLSGGGVNVAGGAMVGVPGLCVGQNGDLAWSLTYAHAHLDDAFVEKLNPEDPHSYQYKGAFRPMEKSREEIRVRGRSEPAVEEFYRTVHGPVMGWDRESQTALSVNAGFFQHEFGTLQAWNDLMFAKNLDEAGKAISHMTYCLNFLVATKGGDIAYFLSGRFPKYDNGIDPRFPIPGTGEYERTTFLDPASLPRQVNPEQGFFLSWNNKQAPFYDTPGAARWGWGRNQRLSELRRVLEDRRKITGGKLALTDLLAMTREVGVRGDGTPAALLPFLFKAADEAGQTLSPQLKRGLAYLKAWDQSSTDWSVAFTLYSKWLVELEEVIFPPISDVKEEQRLWSAYITSTTLIHALEGPRSSVPLSKNYLGERSASEVCLQALVQAIEGLESSVSKVSAAPASFPGAGHSVQQGTRTSAINQMNFWFTRTTRLNLDPLPSIPYTRRGTYLFGVELTPEVLMFSVVVPGQSGDPRSPHFSDQRELGSWYMFKMVATSRNQLPAEPKESGQAAAK